MHFPTFRRWAVVAVLAAPALARADNFDDLIHAEMKKQRIPGLSLAVIKDGKVIKSAGYGLANVELNVPAQPHTVYKIASVSKQFVAAGIVLLAQDGKLKFDDKVAAYLDGTPESWKDITIRHLLTHTSGIVREAPAFNSLKIQDDAEVVKSAYSLPLRFQPGEKHEYCNVGYFALAEIIRKASQKPWPEFLRERIFRPLDMLATRATTQSEIVPNRADGYLWRGEQMQNAAALLAVRPSGALLSTVLDLIKWDAALDSDRLFTAAMREQMWSPAKLNDGRTHPYGFGWSLSPLEGKKRMRHSGSLAGFRSEMVRFVNEKLTIIVLTNCNNANPTEIADRVAALQIPELQKKADERSR
jgi:CubicO group peptidase (beta-lactamase class C family)